MTVKLTNEQVSQFLEDSYISIEMGDYELYLETNSYDNMPFYFELTYKKNGKTLRSYAHGTEELELLKPKRPHDPSYWNNDPLCPNCGTYMIYNFEHCPKCGQKIDWSEK